MAITVLMPEPHLSQAMQSVWTMCLTRTIVFHIHKSLDSLLPLSCTQISSIVLLLMTHLNISLPCLTNLLGILGLYLLPHWHGEPFTVDSLINVCSAMFELLMDESHDFYCRPNNSHFTDIDLMILHMKQIPYHAVVSLVMYAAIKMQPDVAFAVSTLAQFLKKGQAHWEGLKHIFRYVCLEPKGSLWFMGEISVDWRGSLMPIGPTRSTGMPSWAMLSLSIVGPSCGACTSKG